MSGEIETTKVSDRIAARLRDEIVAGKLRPGERLRLVALADRLGVSTTPVREALAVLERQGLVEGRAHRGFRVNELTPRDVADAYALSAFMQRRLAERAVERLSDMEIKQIEELDERMRAASERGAVVEASDLNHEIHRRIGLAGNSQFLLRFLRETTPFVTRRHWPDLPGWDDQRKQGHVLILQALRDRNAGEAGRLMEEHVLHSGALAVQFASEGADSPETRSV
ncbi:GntR family transcriptional regulator [Nocardioides sp.]|uniref:GntR family transcriptional regulator n=1 Tax=Nocardioides sp. TaxID=35761 RepID=UPI003D0DF9B5